MVLKRKSRKKALVVWNSNMMFGKGKMKVRGTKSLFALFWLSDIRENWRGLEDKSIQILIDR
jgi:hypothetical protein